MRTCPTALEFSSALRFVRSRLRRRWRRSRTASDVLLAAEWPRAKVPVVIVGHQPTIGHVASFLLAGETKEWAVKKSGVWWLSSRERDGEEQAVLRAVISPDLL
jgi:phosphohistidine phosphatase